MFYLFSNTEEARRGVEGSSLQSAELITKCGHRTVISIYVDFCGLVVVQNLIAHHRRIKFYKAKEGERD